MLSAVESLEMSVTSKNPKSAYIDIMGRKRKAAQLANYPKRIIKQIM